MRGMGEEIKGLHMAHTIPCRKAGKIPGLPRRIAGNGDQDFSPRLHQERGQLGAQSGAGQGREARRRKRIFSKDTKALLTWRPAVVLSIMNTKQRDTLEAIFSEPVPKNLSWTDIETLLTVIGCKVKNRGGSKVGFGKDNEMLYVHRPHPQKEAKGHVIKKVKDFLISLGVTP